MLRSVKYTLLALPFMLSACGDGYEMIKTDTYFPYGNQRTAGSGVAYVLAQMLPERDLNLQPVKRSHEPIEETKEVLKGMDEVFQEKQTK